MKPLRAGVGELSPQVQPPGAVNSCRLTPVDVSFNFPPFEEMKQHSPDVLIRTGQSSINCVVIWEVISNQERSCQCWLNLNDNRSL